MDRICSKCNKDKPLTEFHKQAPSRSHVKNGYRSECKDCTRESNRLGWHKHIEKRTLKKAEYRNNNPEKIKEQYVNHYKNNPDYYSAKWKTQRQRLRQATIMGMNMHTVLRPFRKKAKEITEKTGIKYSIDHIIPIKGENVSGLNVAWNIQVIPLGENLRKGTKVNGGYLYRSA